MKLSKSYVPMTPIPVEEMLRTEERLNQLFIGSVQMSQSMQKLDYMKGFA